MSALGSFSRLYGLAWKLGALGLDVGRPFASTLAWIWGFVALIFAALASRGTRDRTGDAVLWLGILCLATLRSPFAPNYTGLGSLWLLAILPARRRWPVVVAWILLQGFPPIGGPAMAAMMSLPSQIATIAIALVAAWPRRA